MKSFLLTLLLLVLFCQSNLFAQVDTDKLLYLKKVEKYRRLKTTGITLGVVGGIMTTAGIILVSKADWQETRVNGNTQYTTNDSSGPLGILFMMVGIPATVTGTILGGIGGYKMKQYQKKFDGLALDFNYTPQRQGIRLSYRF